MAREPFEYGALYGSFEFIETPLWRTKGKMRQLAAEAKKLNEQLAIQLQDDVAQALRQRLERPFVSQGTLERVLLDKRNRIVEQRGFGVGIPAYLDKSAAKYWEQINLGEVETGANHVGQVLTGLWGDELSRSSGGHRRIGGAPTGFGRGVGQGFQPMRKQRAGRILREAYGLPRNKPSRRARRKMSHDAKAALRQTEHEMGDVTGKIKNAIEPEFYFKRGWQEFGQGRRIQREYAALFRRLGIPVHWSGGSASPR